MGAADASATPLAASRDRTSSMRAVSTYVRMVTALPQRSLVTWTQSLTYGVPTVV